MTAPPVSLLGRLGPRDPLTAPRTCAIVGGGASILALVLLLASSGSQLAFRLDVITIVLFAAVPISALRLRSSWAGLACLLTPVLGSGTVLALDLATWDASVGAQVFFVLIVLYAASVLRPPGAAVALVSAVVGEAVVTSRVLPAAEALTDTAYLTTVMLLTFVVLARAGIVQDRLVRTLERRAAHDPLTGLVTRHVLDDATRAALGGALDPAGTALVLIDLDHFKAVNDRFGHPVGDEALVHIGRLLTTGSREFDVVARMGGDEIAVLLPGCTHAAALRRAEEFVLIVRQAPLVTHHGETVPLSVSAGVAHAPDQATDVRTLYVAADQALYRAKRAGRDQVGVLV